jgi:hypothetical protein
MVTVRRRELSVVDIWNSGIAGSRGAATSLGRPGMRAMSEASPERAWPEHWNDGDAA